MSGEIQSVMWSWRSWFWKDLRWLMSYVLLICAESETPQREQRRRMLAAADEKKMQILRLTTRELKNVRGPVRSG